MLTTNIDSPLGPYLAAEIRAELARQGMSIMSLAQKAGINRKTLSSSLRGMRDLGTLEVEAVSAALGISGSELYVAAEDRRASGRAVA